MKTKGSEELARLLARHGAMSDLAKKLGVNPSMVSRWAAGDRVPRTSTLARIEHETGIPAGDWVTLLGDEPDTKSETPAAKGAA